MPEQKGPGLPSYLRVLGREGIKAIRKMPESAAREWLPYKYPELTASEIDEAVKLCTPIKTTDARFKHRAPSLNDRLFVIAAWLAGASLNQLARMCDCSRSAILDRLDRALPREERVAARLVDPPISDARLYVMKTAFDVMVRENDRIFSEVHPVRVANILMNIPSEEEE